MKIQDVQRRLQKLLALSSSSNAAEAEVAMSKASEIMTKHGIRTIDVNLETNTVGVTTYSINGFTSEHESWESTLAGSIADPFDAKAIIHYNIKEQRWCLVFVSSISENAIIVDLYKRLRRIISKLSKKYAAENRGREAMRRAYAIGMVTTIHSRLMSLYKDTENTRALVLVKDKAIHDRIEELFGSIKDHKSPSIRNKKAYLTGEKDGHSVCLNKSISDTGGNDRVK